MEEYSSSKPKENETNFKRVIRVGPWKNKEEFVMVYKWLFDENANDSTKQDACKRMTIWRMRRSNLTPATILSTLVMVEMQLKDNAAQITKNLTTNDLRIMYSSSCTRFLNYMSSILQTKNLKTMYETAKELGLGSFIVDLRHLCAHGQTMPDIDLFRRTTNYCIKWLKEYYWDHEIKYMENVDSKDIRRVGRTEFDEKINQLFVVYDAISEAIIKGCKIIQRAKKCLSPSTYIHLKKFSNIKKEKNLKQLLRICVKRLSRMVKQQDILRGGSQVYLEALMSMNFFFESAAYRTTNSEEIALMIEVHQPLFQAMAICGFIESLFRRLIIVAENEYENVIRRKGASFWAHQIVKGFIAFKNFKFKCKRILEKNPNRKFHFSTINSLSISKNILKIYNKLKVDINTTLIFGNSIENPWSLYFKHDYIQTRIIKINEFTENVVEDCLQLVIPSLKEDEKDTLKKLIKTYLGGTRNYDNDEKLDDEDENEEIRKKIPRIENLNKNLEDFPYFTLSHLIDDDSTEAATTSDQDQRKENKDLGIWSRVSDSQDWSRCPIGRLIWE